MPQVVEPYVRQASPLEDRLERVTPQIRETQVAAVGITEDWPVGGVVPFGQHRLAVFGQKGERGLGQVDATAALAGLHVFDAERTADVLQALRDRDEAPVKVHVRPEEGEQLTRP